MKIVNKKEFYKLPEGTLYSTYYPDVFTGLLVKWETLKDEENIPIDYYEEDLIGNVYCDSSDERDDIIETALQENISFNLEFLSKCRNGLYEDDMFFAIYEKKDIEQFIEKLKNLL